MSKLHHRKFARFFPAYHPRAGDHTDFVEKIHFGLLPIIHSQWGCAQDMIYALNQNLPEELISSFIDDLDDDFDFSDSIKHHTIRAGHHVKPGDFIRMSVWGDDINPKLGRKGPYHSKQIIIGPDIEVVKTWDFTFVNKDNLLVVGDCNYCYGGYESIIETVAHNDGLNVQDFLSWFDKPFEGQIICWNKSIEY